MLALVIPTLPGEEPAGEGVVVASSSGSKRARSPEVNDMTLGDIDENLDKSMTDVLDVALHDLKEGTDAATINAAVQNAQKEAEGRH